MHPSREELSGYALATLSEDAAQVVAEHLGYCEECEQTLQELDACDTFIDTLRQPTPPNPHEREPGYRRMLSQIQAIGRQPQAAAGGAQAQRADPAELGSVAEYELLARLGEGGMGAVYKARQISLDRIVALKVLLPERLGNRQTVARFLREIKTLGKLVHPNIVNAHDAGEEDGRYFLVTEYVEGLDLSELVRRTGPLPVADACELARQAALGLQFIHEQGLVHRDVKPSNLMLSSSRQPSAVSGQQPGADPPAPRPPSPAPVLKILDLGLALLTGDQPEGTELTATGQGMGTADYIAPEQATDSHHVDIRADVYSLGCTLYKLLTGRSPFSGDKYKGRLEKMVAHMQESVPSVRALRKDVPKELAALVKRMTAKDPAERPGTPADVAAALLPFATGSDLLALLARAETKGVAAGEPIPPIDIRPSALPAGKGRLAGRWAAARRWSAARPWSRPVLIGAVGLAARNVARVACPTPAGSSGR